MRTKRTMIGPMSALWDGFARQLLLGCWAFKSDLTQPTDSHRWPHARRRRQGPPQEPECQQRAGRVAGQCGGSASFPGSCDPAVGSDGENHAADSRQAQEESGVRSLAHNGHDTC